jgi:hypothetical protein
MAFHVFLFLLVVCLVLLASFAALARFPGSIFSLPPHEEGLSTPESTVSSNHALHLTVLPVASPPPSRRVWSQRLRLCAHGVR